MTDQTTKLIQLIKEGKTCNEICTILQISNKQLYNNLTNLRNKGLFYRRKYYSDGSIVYRPINNDKSLSETFDNTNSIITNHKDTTIKCMIISDLHFGNKLERLDLLDKVFDYCVKSDIHIILCCGDMIDGSFSKGEQTIKNIYDQIEHFIKNYPFDKNILTFTVGGDHDKSAWNFGAQDIIEIIRNYRHDIVVGGYGYSYVNIKNDKILLFHHLKENKLILKNSIIVLHGHAHKYVAGIDKHNILNVAVPSLSDITNTFPTVLELELQFNKGYIKQAYLKQMYFADNLTTLNEAYFDLLKNRHVIAMPIAYEEKIKEENLTDKVMVKN